MPTSQGAIEASNRNPSLNEQQKGDPASDTANFGADGVSNLRVDYVLPSRTLTVLASGVFWPVASDRAAELVKATDHRLTWIDISLTPLEE